MRYEVSCAVTIYVETDSAEKAAKLATRLLQLMRMADYAEYESSSTAIMVVDDKGEVQEQEQMLVTFADGTTAWKKEPKP